MTRTALAISPHLDDAAFSAGATLAKLAREGWRVVVATLFTGNLDRPSGFALECQTSKGIDPEVDYMALRRAEDVEACRALGAEPVHLPILEAPHRGYGDAAALFGPVRNDDPALSELEPKIAGLLQRLRPALVLAPQAVGAHVDHLLVHSAVRASGAFPVWFWRDWPYARREDAPEPFGDGMRNLRILQPRIADADATAKRAACHAYASQLGFQFGGPKGLDEALAADGPEAFALREG